MGLLYGLLCCLLSGSLFLGGLLGRFHEFGGLFGGAFEQFAE